MFRIGAFKAVAAAVLLCTAGAPSAAVVNQSLPGSAATYAIIGDTWTFNCPRGGSFDLYVYTNGQESHYISAGTSPLDPAFDVWDSAGNLLARQDNDVACPIPSITGGTCPQVLNEPCGEGRHYVLVYNAQPTAGAGSYQIQLIVLDADGFLVPDKKVRFGGGAKPKTPKFLDTFNKRTAPLVDDGQIDW